MKKARLSEAATGREAQDPVNPADGVWMFPGFGNTGAVETSDGIVLIDVPGYRWVGTMMQMLRDHLAGPVHTVFLTHGHLDHALTLDAVFDEAQDKGYPPPRVIAQKNLVRRFDRYRMLQGYHDHINRIQFAVPPGVSAFPLPKRYPDITFDQSLSVSIGGLDFHAFYALGETDDALWVWVPEKKTVFAGDLIVMGMPNVGNPFKVQRYAREWAEGLEAIVAKEPDILIPGHGNVLQGKEKIREQLLTISEALRYLHDEVVKRLNAGMWYEDILHEVDLPEHLKQSEYLAPVYGCPKFVVHGILRQYSGWCDGNPSNLFPPKKIDIQKELLSLIGKEAVIKKAYDLKEAGQTAMALQFVDIALADEKEPEEEKKLHRLKGELLGMMGDHEPSYIARNIFYNGHNEEMKLAGEDD
ncbi:MAG: MBL fold metallo-hydrolase [Deltaproteobacteria bacterium]|nr:MBL fold metallo-hydrolase [Deltaproteobacteria bacterium]